MHREEKSGVMPTTAAPKASTTSSVPSSDQESMTPTLSWECDSFPEYNGNNDNMESYPDEDWWNSELLLHPQQYDPFLQASTTTAASMDIIHHSNNNINDDNEKKSAPFRIARRSPKLRLSLPTFANKTTSTLRIQDVLERLDLDQTVIGVNNERALPSPSCNRASPNDDNTLDSDFCYFWNTKSPCQWHQHHKNHKRQRCHPPRPPMVMEEIGHTTVVTSAFVTTEGFSADWTIFPREDETLDRNHDGSIVPFISDPSNIEWSLEKVTVPPHSPTNSTNCQSILLEGSSLDGTTASALSFTTPTQNNPKRKCRRVRTKSLDLPSSSSTSMEHYSTTVHDKDSNANADERKNHNAETRSASLVSTVNEHGNTHLTISTNCTDVVDDANVGDGNEATNLKQSAVARISTTNDDDNNNAVWQLLRQNGTMQENDLLRRNNRQVLHRLAYAQLMGMHITH